MSLKHQYKYCCGQEKYENQLYMLVEGFEREYQKAGGNLKSPEGKTDFAEFLRLSWECLEDASLKFKVQSLESLNTIITLDSESQDKIFTIKTCTNFTSSAEFSNNLPTSKPNPENYSSSLLEQLNYAFDCLDM